MKLWKKGYTLDQRIERFTVGNDHVLDRELVEHDCAASAAHARMLAKIGILDADELASLEAGLSEILELSRNGEFVISAQDEDCHTAIENHLTERLGDVGKKIHTGRSRNDQVLTALRLYEKAGLAQLQELLEKYSDSLSSAATRFAGIGMPGYTHMQRAMPTTAGTWLGSFRDAAADDAKLLDCALEIIDQCPLGTAAGFGVPVLELDRDMTASELGFSRVMENPMYAQLSRGKFEAMIISACTQILLGLNKLASDLTLFNTSEFAFVVLPDGICTGSSIMPQKKNPDVLELVRASLHVVLGEEVKVKSLISNLVSGYNRDLQLTKEPLFNAVGVTLSCLEVMCVVLDGMEIDEEACRAALTEELFATEKAYRLVKQGMPFREAYRVVASTVALKQATRPNGDR